MSKRLDNCRYPETVSGLKRLFPILWNMPAMALELLWEEWSGDKYCAGHMIFSDEYGREFYEWLFADLPPEPRERGGEE